MIADVQPALDIRQASRDREQDAQRKVLLKGVWLFCVAGRKGSVSLEKA